MVRRLRGKSTLPRGKEEDGESQRDGSEIDRDREEVERKRMSVRVNRESINYLEREQQPIIEISWGNTLSRNPIFRAEVSRIIGRTIPANEKAVTVNLHIYNVKRLCYSR